MASSTRVSLLDHRTGTGVVVRLAVDPGTPVSEVLRALRPFCPSAGDLYVGDRTVASYSFFGDLGLVDGQVLSVGGPSGDLFDRSVHRGVDVMVVGGPDSGRVRALSPGQHVIGRDPTNSVPLPDPEASRHHARLDVGDGMAVIHDLGSVNGTLLDGVAIRGAQPVAPGQYVRVGRSVLSVAAPEPPDAALVRGSDGTLTYNRRFRVAPPVAPAKVEFPTAFEEEPPPTISLLYVLAPVLAGVVLAAVLRNPLYLAFAVLGPVTGIAGMVASRRSHRARQARQRIRHDQELAQATASLAAARALEVQIRRDAAPDLATLVHTAHGPRHRLWERRPSDDDFLELRVGLADLPARVVAAGATAPPQPPLADVPVTVPVIEAGSVGVAGPLALATGIARSLIFQVAALHSPSEVRLMIVSPDAEWSWARWLPHLRAESGSDTLLVGADPASTIARLDELDQMIATRSSRRTAYGGTPDVLPRLVVLLDRPSRLDRSRVHRILAEGPRVGIHAICIEEHEAELPEEHAGASVVVEEDRLKVRVRGRPQVPGVSEELIGAEIAEAAARCLASLRPEAAGVASLPQAVRFLELISQTEPTSRSIAAGWAGRDGRCRATVGVAASGALAIELDDRAPHGLVAGTSGAGKSEFLKTFLAGLAVANHPDDLQFLLIDFKGGGDFRTLARLPHTIDLVTNTDDPEQAAVTRALDLLEAEVERRERLVNENGARDLATYRTARAARPDLPVLGRLLVVADEFGELASRRPELLDKLVSVARVGRAMGVHLLLATQRPSGSITPQIQANVPLRLCFRVLDGEADEVIGTRQPEQISRHAAGRGYVRYGDEPPIEMQCARVANARPGVTADVAPMQIDVETWSTVGHPREETGRGPEVLDPDTDLWVLVEAIIEAAREVGWDANPVPWPRPLPESVRFLPDRAVIVEATGPAGVVGTRDDPRFQRHVPHTVSVHGGNIAVVGAKGSGRTTALRTIATALAYSTPPNRLHLHAIDMGGGLRSINPLPHVGTVTDDPGLIARLLDRLEEEVDRRRGEFAAAGWSNLPEQWADPSAESLPAIGVLIDGWESLVDLPGSARVKSLSDRAIKLLGDGSSVGVLGVVAGDRTASAGQLGRLIANRLVLRFNDTNDYAYAEIDSRHVPRPHPDGRALVPTGRGAASQVQLAHVGRDATGSVQVAGLRVVGTHLTSAATGLQPRPWRLATLPIQAKLVPILDAGPGALEAAALPIPIGVGGDEAEPIWVDLAEARPGLMIAGPRSSGRTTALCSVATSLARAGASLVLGGPKPSALAELGSLPGVVEVVDYSALTIERIQELVGTGPVVFVVDDADLIDKKDPVLTALTDACTTSSSRLVAAGTTEDWRDVINGWPAMLRKSRLGLLLCPGGAYDGQAIGMTGNLNAELQFSRPAGRALLVGRGPTQIVQVPAP